MHWGRNEQAIGKRETGKSLGGENLKEKWDGVVKKKYKFTHKK